MPEPTPSDRLTFEIDGPRITAQRFKASFESFLQMANSVANTVAGKANALDWILTLEPGSVRVHLDPEPRKMGEDQTAVAVQAIKTGLQQLESGKDEWPEYFTEKALKAARVMAEVVSKSKGELTAVRLRHNGSTESVSSQTLATVDGLLKGRYSDHGTLEGKIQVLDGRGSVRFLIEDDLNERTIRCYFPKRMWKMVIDAFDPFSDRRVSVSGMILYRRDGQPVNITVEEFRGLRPKEELPSVADMIGIMK